MGKERIEKIAEEIQKLNPIKEKVFDVEFREGVDEGYIALGVVYHAGEDSLDIVWVEDSKEGVSLAVNPVLEVDEKDLIGLWTILYCAATNIKKLDKGNYKGISANTIAEDAYENSLGEGEDIYIEPEKEILKPNPLDVFPIEESEELTFKTDMDSIADLIMSYSEEDEALIIDFFNRFAEISGEDIVFDVVEEDEVDNVLGTLYEYEEKEGSNPSYEDHLRTRLGLLETNYVHKNLSTMVNQILIEAPEQLEAAIFINQLIYERTSVETFIKETVEEKKKYDK